MFENEEMRNLFGERADTMYVCTFQSVHVARFTSDNNNDNNKAPLNNPRKSVSYKIEENTINNIENIYLNLR